MIAAAVTPRWYVEIEIETKASRSQLDTLDTQAWFDRRACRVGVAYRIEAAAADVAVAAGLTRAESAFLAAGLPWRLREIRIRALSDRPYVPFQR